MKKGILLIGVILISISISFAQKHKDYIISLTQDTIFGKISLYDAPNVVFRHHKKKFQFHPASIGNFGVLENGEYQVYKSIKNAKGAFAIVRVIDNRKLKLYEYKKRIKRQLSVKTERFYMIGYSDQKLTTLSPTTFGKAMSAFFKDKPNLLPQLATSAYEQIPQLVSAYNQSRSSSEMELLTLHLTTK